MSGVFRAVAELGRTLIAMTQVAKKEEEVGPSNEDPRARPALLAAFVGVADPVTLSPRWSDLFAEPPAEVIRRFVECGDLAEAPLVAKIVCAFNVPQLKDLARQRGLRVGGRKLEIAQRLIDVAPVEMATLIGGRQFFTCTPQGRAVAEEYQMAQSAHRDAVELSVRQKLASQDFAGAVAEVAAFEATRLFVRGMGVDWKNYNAAGDVVALQAIYSHVPGILKGIKPEAVESLRLAAAMMLLWGVSQPQRGWLPAELQTGSHLDNGTAARMFVFYAFQQRQRHNWSGLYAPGLPPYVRVSACGADSCPECQKIANKKTPFAEAPELPYPHCTSVKGCRCILAAESYP